MTDRIDLRDEPGDHSRDDDIDAELRRLVEDLAVPVVPPAEDVARGRKRLRRQRLAVAGSALATLAVVGVGAVALSQGASGPSTAPYAGGSPTAPASTDRTAPAPADQPGATVRPALPKETGGQASLHRHDRTLSAWNDVLAEHLDPRRDHLQQRTRQNWNFQSGSGSLGSKFAWTVEGQPGMGMLQVQVADRWAALDLFCGDPGWTCRDAQVPGTTRARVASHDGATTVVVQHPRGQVVLLTFDPLFGNNSEVPVSGTDISESALLAAAADARLRLPGSGD